MRAELQRIVDDARAVARRVRDREQEPGLTTDRLWDKVEGRGSDDEQSGTTAGAGWRDRDRRHSSRRPQPVLAAEHTGDPAPAAPGTLAAVPDRGDLALRRARAGLVLEQHLLRRAHGHPLRCAGTLDHRPRAARCPHRHHPAAAADRAGLRDRLFARRSRPIPTSSSSPRAWRPGRPRTAAFRPGAGC